MAAYAPTLVIRLNIDIETAMARQPDHDEALIARKIATTPRLRFNGAPIVDIDASRPYRDVRTEVVALVKRAL
ncbi:MAG: hypothetical protein WDN24_18350 [Sphingomonas sp.]